MARDLRGAGDRIKILQVDPLPSFFSILPKDGRLGVSADLAFTSALLFTTLGVPPIPSSRSNLLIRGIDSAIAIAAGSC